MRTALRSNQNLDRCPEALRPELLPLRLAMSKNAFPAAPAYTGSAGAAKTLRSYLWKSSVVFERN